MKTDTDGIDSLDLAVQNLNLSTSCPTNPEDLTLFSQLPTE